MNFLSSAKGYVGQVKVSTESSDLAAIKALFADQYDNSLAYRTMDALRNYTQHCGLPTHGITYHMGWEDKGDPDKRKSIFSVIPSLDVASLSKDRKFKPTVLKELESVSDRHPIMPFVRQYLAAISFVNAGIRALYKERQPQWLTDIETPRLTWCNLHNQSSEE